MRNFFLVNLGIFLFVLIVILGGGFVLLYNSTGFRVTGYALAEEEEDKTPPAISNIAIDTVTATSAVIKWETNELADSLVNYGLNKNYGIARDPRFDKQSHEVILEELLPNTIYYARITSSDANGNQGISNDYSFTTIKDKEEEDKPKEGYAEEVITEGKGGLYQKGNVEAMMNMIEDLVTEEQIQDLQEKIKKKAEEVVKPPTIILDMAKIEVGVDWAIIRWETDKESDTMVSLAEEARYNPDIDDPYTWNEGDRDESVLVHEVEITGLKPATIYHFQVSSESEVGLTGKSKDNTFKTKSVLPEISNVQITKIEEDSATIKWTTNIPCSSIIEYSNLNSGQTKLEGNSSFLTFHTIRLTNLMFETYYSAIIRVESEDGEKAESAPLTFITIKDAYPPVVSKVNTESTLYPGSENKIQTIASWVTDELAQCQLFYNQGLVAVDEPQSLTKGEDYNTKHVQVITNFLPSTVYKFWLVCNDETGNSAKSEDFTMLTPTQEESIIDIIIKNFESSFGWVKKVGGN